MTNESDLDLRRRKLRYRAAHRGTREMDFVLGRFTDAEADSLTETEMTLLEDLMEVPDPEIFAWVIGQAPVPPRYDTPVFRRLIAFHRAGRGADAQ